MKTSRGKKNYAISEINVFFSERTSFFSDNKKEEKYLYLVK